MPLSQETLLAYFSDTAYRPSDFRSVCADLRLRGAERSRLRRMLISLRRSGFLLLLANRRYALATSKAERSGGDAAEPPDSKTFVGRVVTREDGRLGLRAFGHRLPFPILLRTPLPPGVSPDDDTLVAVRVDRSVQSMDAVTATVSARIGPISDPSVDSLSVIHRLELPLDFTKEALREAQAASPWENPQRLDLRDLPFVTIDGADARDFDDAVALDSEGMLWVAVADVSAFVRPESALDREAAARGNSYYFPDRVLPMLPERLSNDLCSLRPKEDRLVLAIRLPSKRGEARIVSGIIRSKARLTYDEVDEALSGKPAPDGSIRHMLSRLGETTREMFVSRLSEGGVDFELSETEVVLDASGGVEAMRRRSRTPAARIVEEMMLAANRAVAGFLSDQGMSAIFRVHEAPAQEKFDDFLMLLRAYGYRIQGIDASDHRAIHKLLARLRLEPRGKVFTYLALRSMREAHYSAENSGHFGLGFEGYCHFTSPIRRYADLVVHRLISATLGKSQGLFPKTYGSLETVAAQVSARERTAAEAEREVRKIKGVRFFSDKVGSVFSGMVNGVTRYGLFVELDDHAVDGFVHTSRLPFDRYDFFESELKLVGRRRRRAFRIGDRMRVRVERADIEAWHLDFVLAP